MIFDESAFDAYRRLFRTRCTTQVCTGGQRPGRGDRVRQAFSAWQQTMHTSATPRLTGSVRMLIHCLAPSRRSARPEPEHVAFAVDGDAHRHVDRPVSLSQDEGDDGLSGRRTAVIRCCPCPQRLSAQRAGSRLQRLQI